MSESQTPTGVLLVGSVPLNSTQEVFTKLCSALPERLLSIPDGETGSRYNYVSWQKDCFPTETLILHIGGVELPDKKYPKYTLESIKPTKYDDAAISSYHSFLALRQKGIIPVDMRIQVCLPTPINSIMANTRPEFHKELEPLYEQRFQEGLSRISDEIPGQDLAIQWDLAFDVIVLEYERGRIQGERFKAAFSPVKEGILQRVSRLCTTVSQSASMGFHFCYGDLRHKHFVEPEDLGLLVELANDLINEVGSIHSVDWIHMPVPKGRTDTTYFEPLKNLKLSKGCRLYLGVVHANDEAGTKERIRAAQSVFKEQFGVATECGLGRTPKEELDSILRISKSVTSPWKSDDKVPTPKI